MTTAASATPRLVAAGSALPVAPISMVGPLCMKPLQYSVAHYQPNSTVKVVDNRGAGLAPATIHTDSNGAGQTTVQVASAKRHSITQTITANGLDTAGNAAHSSVKVTIPADAVCDPTGPGGSTGGGHGNIGPGGGGHGGGGSLGQSGSSGGGQQGGSARSSSGSSLPFTGSNVIIPALIIGLVLILLGAAFAIAARRRRPHATGH